MRFARANRVFNLARNNDAYIKVWLKHCVTFTKTRLMKTTKILAALLCSISFSCSNRTANSEDNNSESHLGTDIQRQAYSRNDSLPSPDVAKTPTDTATPASEGNATQAAQQNQPVKKWNFMTREKQFTDDQDLANEHLANERTFLAWLSASVAIMAFGFVVVKFSLFAKQFSPVLDMPSVKANDYSSFIGSGLVLAGAFATLIGWARFRHTRQKLREGNFAHSANSLTFLAGMVFFASVLLVVYLVYAAVHPQDWISATG